MHPTRSLSDGSSFFWYRLKMTNPSESEIMPTTILVDVQLQRADADEHDASLQELRQLIETLENRGDAHSENVVAYCGFTHRAGKTE